MKKGYLSPGVYLEETSLLPKSIAQVETAIPAFVGFTERALFHGLDFHLENKIQPLEINSMEQYFKIFGGPPAPYAVQVELDDNNMVKATAIQEVNYLYYTVKFFFENGGSTCLIVSVGNYRTAKTTDALQHLLKGLGSLEKTDAPTLLVISDAAMLSNTEAGKVHTAMLVQCGILKNRFAILDMVNGNKTINSAENPVEEFRNHVGKHYLSYGAVWYPWVTTAFSHKPDINVILNADYFKKGKRIEDLNNIFSQEIIDAMNNSDAGISGKYRLPAPVFRAVKGINKMTSFAASLYNYFKDFYHLEFSKKPVPSTNPASKIHEQYIAKDSAFHKLLSRFYAIVSLYNLPVDQVDFLNDFKPFTFSSSLYTDQQVLNTGLKTTASILKSLSKSLERIVHKFFTELEGMQVHLFEKLKQADITFSQVAEVMELHKIVIPPGGAVAGIISAEDREQGVWKVPANVALMAANGPFIEITHQEMETLNVDVLTGKSVNAIRSFPGKGTLIWGGRTLAGNDNEWRYISVRRLFIMVEQSILEATSQFIFEVNEFTTWIRLKTVIENFLIVLWKAGALQGAKPEHAFFVKVGLGQTMTMLDIQNNVMITEIGLAVVRPAEFILLKILHKIQKS